MTQRKEGGKEGGTQQSVYLRKKLQDKVQNHAFSVTIPSKSLSLSLSLFLSLNFLCRGGEKRCITREKTQTVFGKPKTLNRPKL